MRASQMLDAMQAEKWNRLQWEAAWCRFMHAKSFDAAFRAELDIESLVRAGVAIRGRIAELARMAF